ncbi:hypothetical protein ORI98_10920 [Shewanella sp. ULN5]|uniref:ABC-three component system protein n=1 Tax=Shewanella sp. ULN5 TaxID=2994678 RepID=UPI00273D4C5C|nr:ABC-three component system protein [Shewanella sp. ULN5]MDP5146945.1 hypothetical protein [Shewanella sp. ULN5]
MTLVTSQIANSSAIPAWSGFVYQGKVALYHAIRLLVQKDNEAFCLKVETLDDFVIHNSVGSVLSIHQVKAMKSGNRSAYEPALKQASKVSSQCNSKTIRWFHVSTDLDDFTDRAANVVNGEFLVQFYVYHDERYFVETGFIDTALNQIVTQYLADNRLLTTEQLVEHKLAKLQMLLASRVNLAHHRNQNESINKFEAADSIPINFTEIVDCLHSVAIHDSDYDAVLFRFRTKLLERTDKLLESHQDNQSIDLNDLFACRHFIASMNTDRLTRLYYSKVPNQNNISLEGFSVNSVEMYLDIIAEIKGIRITQDLPHYFKSDLGAFLPTSMQFRRTNQKINIDEIQDNVTGMRRNPIVQDVLYDYENLIVDMPSPPFRLCEQSNNASKFTDISETDKNRFTKINNVRFVSVRDASGEINDQ